MNLELGNDLRMLGSPFLYIYIPYIYVKPLPCADILGELERCAAVCARILRAHERRNSPAIAE